MSRTMEVGEQKESQEELPGTKNKRKQYMEENQDKQKKTTKKDTGSGTNNFVRFRKNTAYARFGVQVFRCSDVQVFRC